MMIAHKIQPNVQMACVTGGVFLSAVLCSYVGIRYDLMTAVERTTGPLLALISGIMLFGYMLLPRHHDKLFGKIFLITTGIFLLIAQVEAAFVIDNNMAFYQIWVSSFYLMLTYADRRRTRLRWTLIYFGLSATTVAFGLTFGNTSVTKINGLLMINALIGQLVILSVFEYLGKTLRRAGAHEAQAKTLALSSERLKVAAEMANNARIEAERANAAKSAFIANMSHELRTPLNAIIGFSDILSNASMHRIAQKRFNEYGTDINASGRHLLQIVNDILDVAKIEAGRMDILDDEIDLRDVIDDAIALIGPHEKLGHRQFITDGTADIPLIIADQRMATQIMTNILSNAVKHTDNDGIIRFNYHISETGDLVLSITDNGTGIEAEALDTIMEPFVQGENVYTRQNSGTGLGLHLVNLMMSLHGGTCEIASNIGEGTMVTLTIPNKRVGTRENQVA